jgi:predicted ATP-grasp superfamily ATP-dependent carboligase
MPSGPGALVLGSDYKALGVARSLGRHGIPVWVVRDEHSLANWSRYTRRSFSPPAGDQARRVEYLLELGRRFALDGWALFPTDDEGAALLARNFETLSRIYVITVPHWETLRWTYDKRLTYQLATDLHVDHPRTHYPRDKDDVLAFDGRYPAILKPAIRSELNRFTASKAWPAEDGPTLVARYEEATALVEPALIMIQELIPGGGESQLSFAALCREGIPVASLVARRTRQWPMDFGRASTYVETVEAPEVEEIARRILESLRFDGIVEVEFKRDARDGTLKLLDINPRVWGWHSLGRRAGVDFPYLLWRLLRGERVEERRGRTGVRWVRALTDLPVAIGEMRAGRLSIPDYVSSLRGPIEFAILAGDDPLPAVAELPAALHLAWLRRRRGKAASGATRAAGRDARGVQSGSGSRV